jgi:hypothetical protein
MTQAIFIGGSYALRTQLAQTRLMNLIVDYADDTDDL